MTAQLSAGDSYFLIVRDRFQGSTDVHEFHDSAEALRAYGQAETRYRTRASGADPSEEVVLIVGESVESVRDMYPQYFAAGPRAQRRLALVRAV